MRMAVANKGARGLAQENERLRAQLVKLGEQRTALAALVNEVLGEQERALMNCMKAAENYGLRAAAEAAGLLQRAPAPPAAAPAAVPAPASAPPDAASKRKV